MKVELESSKKPDAMPVMRERLEFDPNSGSLLERLIFNHRSLVLVVCLLVTAVLGFQASKLSINASFEKTIPSSHPYIRNYLDNEKELPGLGNTVRIAPVQFQPIAADDVVAEVRRATEFGRPATS